MPRSLPRPRPARPCSPSSPRTPATQSLRNIKRLSRRIQLIHATPPTRTPRFGCSNTHITDEPTPSLHPHYRSFTTTTSRSAGEAASVLTPPVSGVRAAPSRPAPRRNDARRQAVSNLAFPKFRAGAADRAHAAFMPDTAWPVNGTPARLIPGPFGRPGFDAN